MTVEWISEYMSVSDCGVAKLMRLCEKLINALMRTCEVCDR